MKRFFQRTAISVLLCFASLHTLSAISADDLVTEPEQCVFLGFPNQLAYLQEDNLLLMVNGGGVYAFDVASGKERWHRHLPSHMDASGKFHGCGADLGRRQVLFWSDPELFLLDMKTGQETWRQRDTQFGDMRWAQLSPDESQVLASCTKQHILFSVAGRTQRVLPKSDNALGARWLTGINALVLTQREKQPSGGVCKWSLMDISTGEVGPPWERTVSRDAPELTISSMGQCAEAIGEGKDGTTLSISDARTGALLREFKGVPGRAGRLVWTEDGKRLFYRTIDERQVRLVDAETGLAQCTLVGEDHRFVLRQPFEDAAGTVWAFSLDAARNLYAWPMTADSAPRKVFDGAFLGPQGGFKLHVADPNYALFSKYSEDRTCTYTAYTLDGRQKLAEWRIPQGESDWHQPLINRSMTHCVSVWQADRDVKDLPKNLAFSVFAQDKTAPVFKGRGNPLALSPDARFLAVQSGDTTASLYEVHTGRAVSQYATDRKEDRFPPRMRAAFSDNGTRFVLNTTTSLEVTDLTEGYARRTMAVGTDARIGWAKPCPSPDGASVLCGGGGGVRLFDAATGALLRSFEEPDPAAHRAFGPGAESSLADAFFIAGGARVVTLAGKQIIGVWDAATGALLHSIQTGLPEKRVKNRPVQKSVVFSATGRFAFCFSSDGSVPATLWSLADGTLQRRCQLSATVFTEAVPADDGTAVYVQSDHNLYRWPGVPKDSAINP